MRPLPLIMRLPIAELTKEEKNYLAKYIKAKNYRHAKSFVYHSRKLPEEPDGKPYEN